MKQHSTTIKYNEVIKDVESRTFKFGKAREQVAGDKLTNNVKLADMPYERKLVYGWIENAVNNIHSEFIKYANPIRLAYTEGHLDEDEYTELTLDFSLPNKWDSGNGIGFDKDCKEYVVNYVISNFLELSLPKEAELYAQKAVASLKNAERKLYFKRA